jgi:hypothetical protein
MTSASPPDDPQFTRRVNWLCRLLGLGVIVLIGVTWRLWTPQDVFPRVPLFAWVPPRWWDWASLAIVAAGSLGLLVRSQNLLVRRGSAAAIACGFAVQFLADQHRLQPWAWQFFILAMVIALADDRLVFRGWFLLVCLIYAWSALSKADTAFVDRLSPIIYRTLATPLEATGLKWSPQGRWWCRELARFLADLVPAVEVAIPILAAFLRTRRWGLLLSVAMHLYLFMLLGPWGLGHHPGVLLWNLFFIGQNWLLFGERTVRFPIRSLWICDRPLAGRFGRTRRWTVEVLLFVVFLWPAVEPWGYCDAWPGWAVYVPRFQRVDIRVEDDALDSEYRFLKASAEGSGPWKAYAEPPLTSRIYESQMSLKSLGTPGYPNHRFSVGVALDWQLRGEGEALTVDLFARPSRFESNSKFVRTLTTPAELEAYALTFRVNALPESVLRRRAAGR